MEFKGTKGNWESMQANQMGVPYIIFVDNETIFQCYGEKAKENMQLAKCAAEMLVAAINLIKVLKKYGYNKDSVAFKNNEFGIIEQLINKATS